MGWCSELESKAALQNSLRYVLARIALASETSFGPILRQAPARVVAELRRPGHD